MILLEPLTEAYGIFIISSSVVYDFWARSELIKNVMRVACGIVVVQAVV
jgi:hypothetical protein